MRARAHRSEGISLGRWERREGGNLLGYVGLSLPSEYEKGIPRETFEGRGWRGWRPGHVGTPPPLWRGGAASDAGRLR